MTPHISRTRCVAAGSPGRSRAAPPPPPLPTGSGAASIRSGSPAAIPTRLAADSWLVSFQLLEELANFRQFLGRHFFRLDRPQHELARRPAEHPLQQIVQHLTLRLFLGLRRRINLRPPRLVARQ